MKIIKLELDKLKSNLKNSNTEYSDIVLNFDKSLYTSIYKEGIDHKMGARPLKRTIEKEISTVLAKELLIADKVDEFTVVTVKIIKGKVVVDVDRTMEIDSPPFYMQSGKNE